MSCPHSQRDSPDRCSQCLGIAPRRVDQHGADLLVDGQPAGRPINAEDATQRSYYGKRGAKASHRRTRT